MPGTPTDPYLETAKALIAAGRLELDLHPLMATAFECYATRRPAELAAEAQLREERDLA